MAYNVDNIESKGEINPTMNTDIILHKDGKFERAKIFGFNGKIKPAYVESVVNNYNSVTENNYSINVDPEQIVPTEAMLNYPANVDTDAGETEIIAYDVLKRVDDGTRTEQTYKETTTNIDGVAMTDAMVDGFAYIKRGAQYYINSHFKINREVSLDSYGLLGDDTFRTISTVFPWVTLADVQLLDAGATLSDSADWYMLMWLNYNLPVNSTVYLTGKYVINREITWRRSSIKWSGKPLRTSSKYQSDKVPQIRQIGEGKHCIAFRDGDGRTNEYGANTQILNVTFEYFNIIGTKTAELKSGHGILIDIPNGDMVLCYFNYIRVINNGLSGLYHTTGHVNDVYFTHCQMYLNFDTGMWLDGKPSSQTNLLGFDFCSFGSNGFVIRSGEMQPYDHTIDGIDYTKGGISIGNISSTNFNSNNTQSNNGFGFMAREGASFDGIDITGGYSEMNPLGDYVMFCHPGSNVIMNTNCQSEVYFEGDTLPPAGHFSVFKTREHYRRFIPSAGVAHNRKLNQLPWSDNIITNAKTRELSVGGGTFTHSYSTDATGSKVLNVIKTGGSGLTYVGFLTPEEYTLIPIVENTQEGTVLSFSFDIKFDELTGVDVGNFGNAAIGIRGFTIKGITQLKTIPTADGTWKRVHLILEYNGTPYETAQWTNPTFFIDGVNNINFSIRNPQFKIKSEQTYFP